MSPNVPQRESEAMSPNVPQRESEANLFTAPRRMADVIILVRPDETTLSIWRRTMTQSEYRTAIARFATRMNQAPAPRSKRKSAS